MMFRKIQKVKSILSIPSLELPEPRILFTMDLDDMVSDTHTLPILDVFARHGIAVTVFACNLDREGKGNYEDLSRIVKYADENNLRLEVGSHALEHTSFAQKSPEAVAERIKRSVSEFRENGIAVEGFRAPFLSTENRYREILRAVSERRFGLKYDSSVNFESNLKGSLFHLITARKCPHRVDGIWELPISCLDDYHLLDRKKSSARFAYAYWRREILFWLWRLNYCMVLFHPHIMCRYRDLLAKLLSDCRRRFPVDTFKTCSDFILELASYTDKPCSEKASK